MPAVLHMVHDAVIAGHLGKERTLTAARAQYFCPTMRLHIDEHVAKFIQCAQYKGTSGSAPVLEYPPPNIPWDVLSIDLLQLPSSAQGVSIYWPWLTCFQDMSPWCPSRKKLHKTLLMLL